MSALSNPPAVLLGEEGIAKPVSAGSDARPPVDDLRPELAAARREVEWLTEVVASLSRRNGISSEIPPEELRLHVGARGSVANFWLQGINSSGRVLEIFGGAPAAPILDWGCGSGRTLRWLMAYPAYRRHYHGCDVDREAVGWVARNLTAQVAVCADDPPLPYPDRMFGGLFAFSVLTHIHPERHRRWYEELWRVVKPGARAYLTTQGSQVLKSPNFNFPESSRAEFHSSGYTFQSFRGHYKDAALCSEAYTRALLEDLFVIEEYRVGGYQELMDAIVVRRKD